MDFPQWSHRYRSKHLTNHMDLFCRVITPKSHGWISLSSMFHIWSYLPCWINTFFPAAAPLFLLHDHIRCAVIRAATRCTILLAQGTPHPVMRHSLQPKINLNRKNDDNHLSELGPIFIDKRLWGFANTYNFTTWIGGWTVHLHPFTIYILWCRPGWVLTHSHLSEIHTLRTAEMTVHRPSWVSVCRCLVFVGVFIFVSVHLPISLCSGKSQVWIPLPWCVTVKLPT